MSCQMKEFVTDDLPNLIALGLTCNNLTTLDISKYPRLAYLNCAKNSNLSFPLQTLIQKIKDKEKGLAELQTELEKEKNKNKLLSEQLEFKVEVDNSKNFIK